MSPATADPASSVLPADLKQKIADGDFDAVEDLWLARIEEAPGDLPFFTAAAKAVSKADSETASTLLQLLDDQLVDRDHWRERMALLRQSGRSMFSAAELHGALLETLRELYGEVSSFEPMVEKVGLDKAIEDSAKNWKKAEKLEALLAFDVGTVVEIKGKGVARVAEVNMALESFKVVFDHGMELRVGFGGAGKLLTALPEGHFLRRKIEEPEAMEALRDSDPGGLLGLLLESAGQSLTGAEIKQLLTGLVSPRKWTSWWAAARKHPQVLADPKTKRAYMWAATTEDAHGALWKTFEAADPRTQITMLRRDGERDETLRQQMSAVLALTAQKVHLKESGLAAEIWLNLERAGTLPADDVTWDPRKLLADAEPLQIFSGVDDRVLRERVYELTREVRSDWQDLYFQAMWKENEARSLDRLSAGLEESAPERVGTFFDQLVSQPRKAPPAFVWLVERAADRPEWLGRNPLRLMKQLLFALDHRDFLPFRASRLVHQVDSGGALPRLLDHLSQDQAVSALETVQKSAALEDYQREPLVNAIQLRFPDLHEEKEAPLYATEASIVAKRTELKRLAEEELPENRKAIESAREMGDLRENFEYHAARKRHELLSALAGKLDEDLRRVRPIDASQVSGAEVVIGARVGFEGDGGNRTITILGPWESDPENDVLSSESDLAKTLLGSKVGDTVKLPDGSYTVSSIEPWE